MVYAKKPFAGPQAVLSYLSRYTHRVAIGNARLLGLDRSAGRVTFSYKDYADQGRRKRLELDLPEFLRRFALHLLPARFVKIRHYGLLANRHRAAKVAVARARLGGVASPARGSARGQPEVPRTPPPQPMRCPGCGSLHLILVGRRERWPALTTPADTS